MATFDTVIKNGTIIDGTGLPRHSGDIAIKDGKIAKMGRIDEADADEVIDAKGLIVAPGFERFRKASGAGGRGGGRAAFF